MCRPASLGCLRSCAISAQGRQAVLDLATVDQFVSLKTRIFAAFEDQGFQRNTKLEDAERDQDNDHAGKKATRTPAAILLNTVIVP
jgi:hypothetical protein